jgi:hypothetical protein
MPGKCFHPTSPAAITDIHAQPPCVLQLRQASGARACRHGAPMHPTSMPRCLRRPNVGQPPNVQGQCHARPAWCQCPVHLAPLSSLFGGGIQFIWRPCPIVWLYVLRHHSVVDARPLPPSSLPRTRAGAARPVREWMTRPSPTCCRSRGSTVSFAPFCRAGGRPCDISSTNCWLMHSRMRRRIEMHPNKNAVPGGHGA